MKRVFSMTVLSLLCFVLVAEGAEWVPYIVSNNSNKYYYDSESITYPAKDIVRVWNKVIYSDEGKQSFTELEKDIAEARGLIEFYCHTKERRMIKTMFYNSSQKLVLSGDKPMDLEPISPESNADALYKIVCKKMPEN